MIFLNKLIKSKDTRVSKLIDIFGKHLSAQKPDLLVDISKEFLARVDKESKYLDKNVHEKNRMLLRQVVHH